MSLRPDAGIDGGRVRPWLAYARTVLNSYSDILFLRSRWFGAVLLAVTFASPNAALSGMIAGLAAYAFARLIGMGPSFLDSGFYTYNAVLTGLATGFLFRIEPISLVMIAAAGVMTFVLTLAMSSVFATYLRLPILSLPFALVSSAIYLASGRYSNLLVSTLYAPPALPLDGILSGWAEGFLRSLGAIVFSPHVLTGLVLAAALLAISRILLMLALAGYAVGVGTVALLSGSLEQATRDLNGFNFVLIAMALGGVFLVPSPQSYVIAMIAVAVSCVLLQAVEVFWSLFGIPAFTIPFNLTTLLFVYCLGLVGFPKLARILKATPEETLDHFLSYGLRSGSETAVSLPVAGGWTVWQGFDGAWTHKGSWRHAYDFVLAGPDGQTFAGKGDRLEQYYAHRKPVLAPVRGWVTRVVSELPDNAVGQLDEENPWGNLVILRDEGGRHVCLAHLASGSVRVSEGQWVERGAIVGLCGNSGYSPEPHVHMTVQASGVVGAPTLPFRIGHWISDGVYHLHGLPAEGAVVEAGHPDLRQQRRTALLLDDLLVYEVFANGRSLGNSSLTVRLDAAGTTFLETSRGRLYIDQTGGCFRVLGMDGDDPALRALFLALPTLPPLYRAGLRWRDSVPLGAMLAGPAKAAVLLAASFFPRLAEIAVELHWDESGRVVGTAASRVFGLGRAIMVEFDDKIGPLRIEAGDIELRRLASPRRRLLAATEVIAEGGRA